MRRAIPGLLVVACVLVLGAPMAGASAHVQPEPKFAIPSKAAGCGGVTALAGGAARVPVTVSKVAGQVAETVNVCFGSRGPYPFVLDTGDAQSTIDTGLAKKLHLAKDGPSEEFEGVGCTGVAGQVASATWAVEGETLAPQTLTSAHLPDLGGKGEPDGLLGSDVLSSFGAVRLDFGAGTLTFGGPQGAEATTPSVVHGPTGPPPPSILTAGSAGTTVPITVPLTPGGTQLQVRLRFGTGGAHTFVIDTGASQSVVDRGVAKGLHLAGTDLAQQQATVCSIVTAPLIKSGPWSIPGVTLRPQLIDSTNFGAIGGGGIEGLLGSDQLIRFGWAVFDYKGGRLILG